jgi:hypothetical protein
MDKIKNLFKVGKGVMLAGAMTALPNNAEAVKTPTPVKAENSFNKEKTDPKEGEKPTLSLNISANFKRGTVEFIDSTAEEKAKKTISDFLEQVKDLENVTILVEGTYSIERPYVRNSELAQKRKDIGEKMLMEILNKWLSEGKLKSLPKILAVSRGASVLEFVSQEEFNLMSQQEKDKAIDQAQGVFISIRASLQINVPTEDILKENTPNKTFDKAGDFSDVYAVLLDQSSSMADDVGEVAKLLSDLNNNGDKKEKIKEIKIQGGDIEAHLNTLYDVLYSMPALNGGGGKNPEIIVYTDEPDESLVTQDNYYKMVDRVLALAKKKNVKIIFKIFNIDPKSSDFVTIELTEATKLLLLPSTKGGNFWDKTKDWYQAVSKMQKEQLENEK